MKKDVLTCCWKNKIVRTGDEHKTSLIGASSVLLLKLVEVRCDFGELPRDILSGNFLPALLFNHSADDFEETSPELPAIRFGKNFGTSV